MMSQAFTQMSISEISQYITFAVLRMEQLDEPEFRLQRRIIAINKLQAEKELERRGYADCRTQNN